MGSKLVYAEGFWVEVERTDVPLPSPAGDDSAGRASHTRTGGAGEQGENPLGLRIADTISGVLSHVRGALKEEGIPDEFTLEFGLKLGGEKSLLPFVAKATGEASFKITATWKREAAAAK